MDSNQMQFYDSHVPNLRDGKYAVSVSQTVSVNDYTLPKNGNAYTQVKNTYTLDDLNFHVSGPRFDIDTSLIHSVYPPVGANGDFMADLPSLVLSRSTLPWERSPSTGDLGSYTPSWLFLLLVDESELNLVKEINTVNTAALAETFTIETEDLSRLPAQMNYLEITADIINKGILPSTLQELQYLSYVRIKEANGDENQTDNEEQSVLLCNRLPQPGSNSFVYLVSIENNYAIDENGNSFIGIKKGDKYVFPYLYKWSFHTIDEQLYEITDDVISKVKLANPSITSWPDFDSVDFKTKCKDKMITSTEDLVSDLGNVDKGIISIIENAAKLPGGNFHSLLSHLTNGFGAFSAQSPNDPVLSTGAVSINYSQKNNLGNSAELSNVNVYYRGPLVGRQINLASTTLAFLNDPGETITYTDASSFLISMNGIADQSYASAFELGRLTALNDVDFSTEFAKWKNKKATALRLQTLSVNDNYTKMPLPQVNKIVSEDLPKHLADKFVSWQNLVGIPYRYLVPDTALLPNESLRFFYIDNNWVNAFICGAFSIGHTIEADFSSDLRGVFLTNNNTGFLINSLAVSGWPDFEVDLPVTNTQALLRKEVLDENIKMYIFNFKYNQLKFHLHAGKLHSGFLYESNVDGTADYIKIGSPNNFKINANDITTFQIDENATQNSFTVSRTDMQGNYYIIKICDLLKSTLFNQTQLQSLPNPLIPVSHFAATMMEATPQVVFTIQ